MASTFSPSLRIELIGDGDQSGIWGQTTNNNLGGLIEQAIGGVVTITMVDANYTLTNFNGVVDEARNAVIVATGALSAQRNIIAPLVEKTYSIQNSTTGGFAVQIIGPSGTGVIVPNGATLSVYCDGTDFLPLSTASAGNFRVAGNLTVTGTTTLTGALGASTATFSGAISSVSPSFTGTPTSITAAPGTNTTQIATTAFVQAATAALNLGTMATQNANNVNITGGAINGTPIGATTANTIRGTTGTFTGAISGTTGTFSGAMSAASLAGSAATGSGASGTWGINVTGNSATTSQTNFSNLTINSSQVLAASNFNSYAPTLTGGGASGTWGINISGNAATATNAGFATNSGNSSTTSQTTFSSLTSNGNVTVSNDVLANGWLYAGRSGGFGDCQVIVAVSSGIGTIKAVNIANNAFRTLKIGEGSPILIGRSAVAGTSSLSVATDNGDGSIFCHSGYTSSQAGWVLVNSDKRIGDWAVGSGFLAVFVDGVQYGINLVPSDESTKKNISTSTYDATNTVNRISFKQFDYDKTKTFRDDHIKCGVTSQQLQTVDPDLVREVGDLLQPDDNKLLMIALKGLQEANERIAKLETALAALK